MQTKTRKLISLTMVLALLLSFGPKSNKVHALEVEELPVETETLETEENVDEEVALLDEAEVESKDIVLLNEEADVLEEEIELLEDESDKETIKEYASDYLYGEEYDGFSYNELYDQLTDNNFFNPSDVVEVLKELDINWNLQALKWAEYLINEEYGYSKQAVFEILIDGKEFTDEQAQYAVDNVKVDWNKEALIMATRMINEASYSKEEVIELLRYDGFTEENIQYAVKNLKVNWGDKALERAKLFLEDGVSKLRIIEILENEGFTKEDIQYTFDNLKVNWKEQALKAAQSTLHYEGISKKGLEESLIKYSLFTQEEVDYAMSKIGKVNWKKNAYNTALFNLEYGYYSKKGLEELLFKHELFTQEETDYAMSKIGKVDWKENAKNLAMSLLVSDDFIDYSRGYSKLSLEERLIDELFTDSEVKYALDNLGKIDWEEQTFIAFWRLAVRSHIYYSTEQVIQALISEGFAPETVKKVVAAQNYDVKDKTFESTTDKIHYTLKVNETLRLPVGRLRESSILHFTDLGLLKVDGTNLDLYEETDEHAIDITGINVGKTTLFVTDQNHKVLKQINIEVVEESKPVVPDTGNTEDATIVKQFKPSDTNIVWNSKSDEKGFEIILDIDMKDFKGVFINGVELERDKDYTVRQGSVIVTLLESYLNNLADGNYDVVFAVAGNKDIKASFTVTGSSVVSDTKTNNEEKLPATGQGDIRLVASAFIAMGGLLLLPKRREEY